MRDKSRAHYPERALFVLFTLSGFAGIIYESIWSHYLKLFLGHAAYAQSVVLVMFMGGMAAGAWLAARVGPRITDLLKVYIEEGPDGERIPRGLSTLV